MSSAPIRLPTRFPVGTPYVIEGRRARGRLDVRRAPLSFPMERASISPSIDRAGVRGGSAPARGHENNFGRSGTESRPLRCKSNAGWSAPQPPTPHPSGDRPWPFGRRGLLFCF
jgi:hypothetical protein